MRPRRQYEYKQIADKNEVWKEGGRAVEGGINSEQDDASKSLVDV